MIIDNITPDESILHPIDIIEPVNDSSEYREASVLFFTLLESSIAHALSSGDVRVGVAQIRVALGLSDESMTVIANRLGVTIQCISKGARAFVKENNLPMPRGLEGEESSKAHKAARIKQLNNK